jgi:DNA-binding XRE family transcriptional regulator
MISSGVVTMPKNTNEGTDDLKPRLKVRLAELDIPQMKLAEEMNESKQTISLWANGRKTPTLKKAFRLADKLGCTVDELWEYIKEKE